MIGDPAHPRPKPDAGRTFLDRSEAPRHPRTPVSHLEAIWPNLAAALTLAVTLLASGHAVLQKRDVRAAVAWVGLIWLVPFVGSVLYLLLGVNRIKRRAAALQRALPAPPTPHALPEPALVRALSPAGHHLNHLAQLMNQMVRRPLTEGNRVALLVGGDAAYPQMLEAIDGAEKSLTLCTYIFDNDAVGVRFADALERAARRGVEVRVLADAVGLRYSLPTMYRVLRRRGVKVARFLPARVPWRIPYMNLRNHRKILVADGRLGFTGGMNLRVGHALSEHPKHPVQDLHFRVEGPVVAHLQEVFAEDWAFTTGERLEGEAFFPKLAPAGHTLARGIADGPDEDFEKLRWAILGALACARHSVKVMTPYFLPDPALVTSLNVAALRGVEVDLVLPAKGNLPLVQWAATAQLWQVLEHGCRVHLTPPPFDHSKLLVVDRTWTLMGSGNWDPRSLRLNFELNVECYDPEVAGRLDDYIAGRIASARSLTLAEVDGRPLPVRLRDGVARLFTPYL